MKKYDDFVISLLEFYEDDYHFLITDDTLTYRISRGGVAGGNCWESGGNYHYSENDDYDGRIPQFEEFIVKIKPSITLREYLDFYDNYVVAREDSDNEYYGNYTNYAVREVNLKELYKLLYEE